MNDQIFLIYPYFKTKENRNQKLFNPLGISYLSSILKQNDINVFKLDCTFKDLSDVVKEIVESRPKIIGFYTMISLSRNTFNLLSLLKNQLPQSLYICGGPLATLYPDIFSKDSDIVFKGEISFEFSKFVKDFFDQSFSKLEFIKSYDFSSLPGVYINHGKVKINNEPRHISTQEFQLLPNPDRGGFDHEKYQKFWFNNEGLKMTNIITTLGCPFNCDFCSKPIFGNKFRKRKISNIIQEIQEIVRVGYDT
ncbi:MAG: hypothetical protein GF383_10810, partial [Candidatus Lokiarchaeota archaeon]|nr:hypothetical protein [Candidatus Lokiarchaeota archaeon]MBD3341094.1 hypothetical protein [Candidatus Lokiarchaeota archaeon]